MAELPIEIVGWLGAGLILAAYFLLTEGKLTAKSKTYHLLNLIGGLGIVANAISNSAYPPAGLNIVWIAIAAYGMLKGISLFRKGRSSGN